MTDDDKTLCGRDGRHLKLIQCQQNLPHSRGSFGPLGNVAANGCGSIALYNTLLLLGQHVTYEAVLKQMNRKWWKSTLIGGLLGSNPLYVRREILRRRGVCCRCFVYIGIFKRNLERQRERFRRMGNEYDVFLNLYLHRHGAHYSVAEYQNGVFHVYNDSCSSADHEMYYRDVKALGMIVMGIRMREENRL